MENQSPQPQPFYISEPDALQLMRAALAQHGHLLPPFLAADEKTAAFGAYLLVDGDPGNLLWLLSRAFARALVPFLEQAQAYELAAGMQSAIRLGRSLTDEEGLRGVRVDHMNIGTENQG